MFKNYVFKLFGTKVFARNFCPFSHQNRFLHTTIINCVVQSGRVKISLKRDKPVTYEEVHKPYHIAHLKSWNTWNTTTIDGGLRVPETVFDDMFIRKFIVGTFHDMVCSEVIIKRQYNIIRIAMLILPLLPLHKICFLIGYSEEMLGFWLQCPIKIEIQSVSSLKDTVYKYI